MSGGPDHDVHVRHDSMAPENAQRLAAVLDAPQQFRPGSELPLLWHWAYFPEIVAQSLLGPDGHPARVDALAERLPRRMAASGSVAQRGPLAVGRPAERRSYLADVTEKQGRSGPLAFANWRHTIEQDGQVVLDERQTVVYREAVRPSDGRPARADGAPAAPDGTHGNVRRALVFDTAMLFRFSAVTWNAHRIHYDWPYATGTEGYPGLVVHGPLLAAVLAVEAARQLGPLKWAEFRAQAPVFVNDKVEILGRGGDEGSFTGHIRRPDGLIAMSLVARAEL